MEPTKQMKQQNAGLLGLLGLTALMSLSTAAGCGPVASEDNRDSLSVKRQALSTLYTLGPVLGKTLCIEAEASNNAGTNSTINIHYYNARLGTDTWSCDIDGIAEGGTKCCTLKRAVWNAEWSCGGDGASDEVVFMYNGGSDDLEFTRLLLYAADGSLDESRSYFFAQEEVGSCSGWDWGELKWKRCKVGLDTEPNISWDLDHGANDLEAASAPSCFDNQAVSWKPTFAGYDATIASSSSTGIGNDLLYNLPLPTKVFVNGVYPNLDSDSTQGAIFAGTLVAAPLTGSMTIFEAGGSTTGLHVKLDDGPVAGDSSAKLSISLGSNDVSTVVNQTVTYVPGIPHQFVVAVDPDQHSVRLWWRRYSSVSPTVRSTDLVAEFPWDGDDWAGTNNVGVGQIAGNAYGSDGGDFQGAVDLNYWAASRLASY